MKTKNHSKTPSLTIIITLLLVVSLTANIILLDTRSSDTLAENANQQTPYIELGRMSRTKDTVAKDKLKVFLNNQSNSGCKGITNGGKSYEQVGVVSDDQTQIRIKYGCYYPDSNSIAIYKNGEWQMAETTNQWDEYGNPTCAMVAKFSVTKKIAPVCFMDDGVYRVR